MNLDERRAKGVLWLGVATVILAMVVSVAQAFGANKRELPDYDGRPAQTSLREQVAWVPRVLLYPVYLGWSYAVRWPVGQLVKVTSEARTSRAVFRYLFLGPPVDGPGILPIAYYDFGFQPSLGLRVIWDRGFLGPSSKLSVKLATGGRHWLRAEARERFALGDRVHLALDAGYLERPDQVYFGLGPDAPASARARYAMTRVDTGVTTEWRPSEERLTLRATLGVRRVDFDRGAFGHDGTIEEQVAAGRLDALPEGYVEGYARLRGGVEASWDSRAGGRGSGSGAHAELVAGQSVELGRSRDERRWLDALALVSWIHHFDEDAERVAQVGVRAQLVDDDGGAGAPFTELASLGGASDLRGLPAGRLRDHSAAAITADYRWPLVAWLDASVHLAAGNVLGEHFEAFDGGRVRGSAGVGVALAGLSPERAVELWTAVGTKTVDQGFGVEGVRVVLGYQYAY